jgi:hypothetical protein
MDLDPLPDDHPETGHVSTGALPHAIDVHALPSAGGIGDGTVGQRAGRADVVGNDLTGARPAPPT